VSLFRNDDEKHAWDRYAAAGLAYGRPVIVAEADADDMRREREKPLPAGPRPRPGSGKESGT
jgi:hypothetical protein